MAYIYGLQYKKVCPGVCAPRQVYDRKVVSSRAATLYHTHLPNWPAPFIQGTASARLAPGHDRGMR